MGNWNRLWAHVHACRWAETRCVMAPSGDGDISASFLRAITRCFARLLQTLHALTLLGWGLPRHGRGDPDMAGGTQTQVKGDPEHGPQLGLVRAMNWGRWEEQTSPPQQNTAPHSVLMLPDRAVAACHHAHVLSDLWGVTVVLPALGRPPSRRLHGVRSCWQLCKEASVCVPNPGLRSPSRSPPGCLCVLWAAVISPAAESPGQPRPGTLDGRHRHGGDPPGFSVAVTV